jgi:hypothetical protein
MSGAVDGDIEDVLVDEGQAAVDDFSPVHDLLVRDEDRCLRTVARTTGRDEAFQQFDVGKSYPPAPRTAMTAVTMPATTTAAGPPRTSQTMSSAS